MSLRADRIAIKEAGQCGLKLKGLIGAVCLLQDTLDDDPDGLKYITWLIIPTSELVLAGAGVYDAKQEEVFDGSPQAWVWEQGQQALTKLVCGEADVAVDAFVQYTAYEGAMAQWEEYEADESSYFLDTDNDDLDDVDDDFEHMMYGAGLL